MKRRKGFDDQSGSEGRSYLFSQMLTPASFSLMYAGRFIQSSFSAGSLTLEGTAEMKEDLQELGGCKS